MRTLPYIDEYAKIAREVIWFEEPDVALANPVRFLAYAMTYGTTEAMASLMRFYDEEELKQALSSAPAGIMDERSWVYWHTMLGVYPIPPMPQRQID